MRAGRGELLKFRIEEVVPSHERHGRIHASNGCWKPLARKWNGTKLVPDLWERHVLYARSGSIMAMQLSGSE